MDDDDLGMDPMDIYSGCPHEWPEDIHEEGGNHYCNLCGMDGLA